VATYIIEDNEPYAQGFNSTPKKKLSWTVKDHHFHAPMRQTHVKKSGT